MISLLWNYGLSGTSEALATSFVTGKGTSITWCIYSPLCLAAGDGTGEKHKRISNLVVNTLLCTENTR